VKNTMRIVAIAALFALVFTACDNGTPAGGGSAPLSETYEYVKGAATYKLTITQTPAKAAFTPDAEDTYVLLIITGTGANVVIQTSSGIVVSFINGVLTLQPVSAGASTPVTFTVRISGEGEITAITGTITLEGSEGTAKGPDTASSGGGGNTGGGGVLLCDAASLLH
jgi:hypothetical protein